MSSALPKFARLRFRFPGLSSRAFMNTQARRLGRPKAKTPSSYWVLNGITPAISGSKRGFASAGGLRPSTCVRSPSDALVAIEQGHTTQTIRADCCM
ncbi:hypothetical protein EIP86_002063 [Pleurotus ostreatoroseus]|nr:hypothetical protein EIP86_002063 [Pleurotus ostreatoroseus]